MDICEEDGCENEAVHGVCADHIEPSLIGAIELLGVELRNRASVSAAHDHVFKSGMRIERELDALAIGAVRARAHLEGLTATKTEALVRRVRKALGYTYP